MNAHFFSKAQLPQICELMKTTINSVLLATNNQQSVYISMKHNYWKRTILYTKATIVTLLRTKYYKVRVSWDFDKYFYYDHKRVVNITNILQIWHSLILLFLWKWQQIWILFQSEQCTFNTANLGLIGSAVVKENGWCSSYGIECEINLYAASNKRNKRHILSRFLLTNALWICNGWMTQPFNLK